MLSSLSHIDCDHCCQCQMWVQLDSRLLIETQKKTKRNETRRLQINKKHNQTKHTQRDPNEYMEEHRSEFTAAFALIPDEKSKTW